MLKNIAGLAASGIGADALAALVELQGLNISLLAGAGAGVKIPLAAIRPEDTIIAALNKTRTHADLAVFTITDDRVSRAVRDAHQRGVKIRILSDNDKSADLGSDIEGLSRLGVEVRIDRTPVHMHHKFAILDGSVLLNGSYNWTRSASLENHENLVISHDPSLIAAFTGEFTHCWNLGEAY